ncbi:PREDICTED: uncharacterized protein LOC104817614 [Tarenaya hassleriana]|uniref:uncharacterized protein LOC104817614 n=1 Tax=Tarenaya hassleriana TaxID=28532 RepID=UPI00053C5E52|nr:PREDICTED: uncharacterized protein LOC104817614 [Tarenaya hassleriana]
MGNCLRRIYAVEEEKSRIQPPPMDRRILRIKVRMRIDQFEEILARADIDKESDGGGKLGFLIVKEYMEGRLPEPVVISDHDDIMIRRGRRLVSIKEE